MKELSEKLFARKVFRVYVDGMIPFTFDRALYHYIINDGSLKVIQDDTYDVALFVPLDKLICITSHID